MNLKLCGLAAAVALAFAGTAQAADSVRDMHKAEKERIEATYKADKAKCDPMKGNAKDVCMKEAKGREKVAKAELDARDDKSGNAQYKVAKAKAEADYDVAKERCDDQKGKEKSACENEAKAKRDQALAAAKPSSSTGSSSGMAKRR